MEGPMDDAIEVPEGKKDKARQRLDEFTEQRYPGGVPAESQPHEDDQEQEQQQDKPRQPPTDRATRDDAPKKSRPR